MSRKIIATLSFGILAALVSGCSGAAAEESDSLSAELSKAAKGAKDGDKGDGDKGEGDKGDGDKGGKNEDPSKDDGTKDPGKDGADPDKGDPGKGGGACVVVEEKASCLDDADWKAYAAKLCAADGLTLGGVSTAGDCKGGSSSAKISCCK